MVVDRHGVWREAARIYSHLEEHPRSGYQPVVEVFITGRAAPFIVSVAETHRDPGYPWVRLYLGDEDGGYVLVQEVYVERVEVTYKSTTRVAPGEPRRRFPMGFRVEIAEDDSGFRATLADDDRVA
jgi:hypothetical protein